MAWVAGFVPRWFARPKTVTHPSTNRARRRVTSLIRPTPLPLRGSFTVVENISYCASKQRKRILDSAGYYQLFSIRKMHRILPSYSCCIDLSTLDCLAFVVGKSDWILCARRFLFPVLYRYLLLSRWQVRASDHANYSPACQHTLILRLHDTTGCHAGCTTGLIAGCVHDTAAV